MGDLTKTIKLSKPLDEAKDHYEVVVVGSGYGAAISASRLARAGRKVAILERGAEIPIGNFPKTATEIMGNAQIRVAQSGKRLGKADGLFEFRMNKDISALVGCGLGGTSLINANVALKTPNKVRFLDRADTKSPIWPKVLRGKDDALEPYYKLAEAGLGSQPYKDGEALPKVKALKKSAKALNVPMYLPPINVTSEDGPNHFGFTQAACTNCGDCCSGCNVGAKNTTQMNYLPDARAFGAEIFTHAEVSHFERDGDRWSVHVADPSGTGGRVIQADLLILGAGTIGTTEIMLRTRDKTGLDVSPALGAHFSGNGDVLAFGYNANVSEETKTRDKRDPIYGIGAGDLAVTQPDNPAYRPGPCIAGVIDYHKTVNDIRDGLVIEEGVMPSPLAMAYQAIFFMNEATSGDPFRFGDLKFRLEDAQDVGDAMQTDIAKLADFAYDGPMSRTQTFLVMSHDDSDGVIEFKNNCAVLSWPGAGRDPAILRDNEHLHDASDAIWAEYLPNPMWVDAMGRKIITVHPIGGCVMSDDPAQGVVNVDCQVYRTPDATAPKDGTAPVHEGLYICDGSVIPVALGVNPLLTISAVTERAMKELADARGWTIDYDARKPLPAETEVDPPKTDPVSGFSAKALAETLNEVILGLETEQSLIKAGSYAEAKKLFWQGWGMVVTAAEGYGVDLPSLDSFHWLMTEKRLKKTIGPLIAEFLPILKELSGALEAGDYAKVIEVLEKNAGDFSPDLEFKERMSGYISGAGLHRGHLISNPYNIAERTGSRSGKDNFIEGHFTVDIKSLARMALQPGEKGVLDPRRAALGGTVECGLMGGTFTVGKKATFDLLKQDGDEVETWKMVYQGLLKPKTGNKRYTFLGQKTLKRRPGSNYWTDLTRLEVDIYEGKDLSVPPVYRGVMTLSLQDLAEQVSTMSSELELSKDYTKWGLASEIVWDLMRYKLVKKLKDPKVRADLLKFLISAMAAHGHPGFLQAVQLHYMAGFAKIFAMLVFRTYGGILAYLYDFPGQEDAKKPVQTLPVQLRASEVPSPPDPDDSFRPEVPIHDDGTTTKGHVQLTRYKGGDLGPVILAPGFGVTAASFAMDTTEINLTEYLCAKGYDVWLFDYRGSPALDATRQPFTIDDLAMEDWPAAVETVHGATGKPVQIIAHCFGSASLLMALVAAADQDNSPMKNVKSVISSQTSLHPVTSWLNYAKADAHIASLLVNGVSARMEDFLSSMGLDGFLTLDEKTGRYVMKTVDMSPPPGTTDAEKLKAQTMNAMLWSVPFPGEPVPCYNPVCHRVFGIFGASYLHAQLNEATHNALHRVFGEVSTAPFPQLAEMMRRGVAVSADGERSYVEDPKAITVPVDFIAGSKNQIFLPETTLRTLNWLEHGNPGFKDSMFTRHVFADYGHMDCFVGKDAHRDIFGYLEECLSDRARE
jgi:choline dehydrogenase-like flavoprotein/pimeloyl-ACP methyl ester carboxylesterase